MPTIRAVAVALVLIAASCAKPTQLTAAEAVREYEAAYVALISACYGMTFTADPEVDARAASVQAAVDAGRLTYDASAAADCIAALRAVTCGDALRGAGPYCRVIFAGTVDEGGTCLDSGECNAGYCAFAVGSCPGACAPRSAEGMACSSYGECAVGLSCKGGVCAPPIAIPIGGECSSRPISTASECVEGASCRDDVTSTTWYRCVALSPLDGSCELEWDCEVPLWCDGRTHTCRPWAGTGQGCASAVCNRWTDYCDAETATCQPLPTLGQACAAAGDCGGAAFCDTKLATPVCAALPGVGGDCSVLHWCPAGSFCDVDGTGTCLVLKSEGEPCVYSSECVAEDYCTRRYVGSASGTCAAKQTSGACQDREQCAAGYYCTAVYPGSGTCELQRTVGESCAGWDACASGLACVSGICSVSSCY